MTQITESQTTSSLSTMRDALENAEKQIVRLDGSNITAFLVGLDQIEQTFAAYGQDTGAIRAEAARWESLQKRIEANPRLVVAAAAKAGGLPKLRAQHELAGGSWWHLDADVAQQRSQSLKRTGMAIGAVVVVGLVLWGITAFFPSAASLTDTTTTIEQLVTAQKWPEALAAVEDARVKLPDEAELLVWEAVLHEQAGDTVLAQTSLTQAQQAFVGQPAAFWTLVGNHRLQVNNLDGAEEAGQQALAAAPQDATITFLLGTVAEARGDLGQAADYFSQTIALAEDVNPQLGVIAKVRMGYLAPPLEPLPVPAPAQTITLDETP